MEAVGARNAQPVLLKGEEEREAAPFVLQRVGPGGLLLEQRPEHQGEAAADPAALEVLGLDQAGVVAAANSAALGVARHVKCDRLVTDCRRLDGLLGPVTVRVAHRELSGDGRPTRGLRPESAIHVLPDRRPYLTGACGACQAPAAPRGSAANRLLQLHDLVLRSTIKNLPASLY